MKKKQEILQQNSVTETYYNYTQNFMNDIVIGPKGNLTHNVIPTSHSYVLSFKIQTTKYTNIPDKMRQLFNKINTYYKTSN